MNKIRIGVSRCLLGDNVRYDGQHKRDAFITETLGPLVDYVPVCPEVDCGLSVPREAMRLVGTMAAPRLMTIRSGHDLTAQMKRWIAQRLNALAQEELCGFIFKARSPSSGMERVKIYNAKGGVAGYGSGLFAKAFMERFPLLPVEEEGRLHDPSLRENFVERIFTLKRYRERIRNARSLKPLMDFHADHKYLLMAHSPERVRSMGRLLAESKPSSAKDIIKTYEQQLLETLQLHTSIARHINVLQHITGYLKNELTADEKQEFSDILEEYRNGNLPLVAPVVMIRHYVRKYSQPYLNTQVYLYPHPLEMQLRNHA